MTTQQTSPSALQTLLALLAMLIGSAVLAVAVAYVALENMPCRWFGSAFEGGCGFGALGASAGVALIVFVIAFGCAARLYFRR